MLTSAPSYKIYIESIAYCVHCSWNDICGFVIRRAAGGGIIFYEYVFCAFKARRKQLIKSAVWLFLGGVQP